MHNIRANSWIKKIKSTNHFHPFPLPPLCWFVRCILSGLDLAYYFITQ